MPDSGEKNSLASARRAEARYLRARSVVLKFRDHAVAFGYKQVSAGQREKALKEFAKTKRAGNIMVRAHQGF